MCINEGARVRSGCIPLPARPLYGILKQLGTRSRRYSTRRSIRTTKQAGRQAGKEAAARHAMNIKIVVRLLARLFSSSSLLPVLG